jgi:hypothetical protein
VDNGLLVIRPEFSFKNLCRMIDRGRELRLQTDSALHVNEPAFLSQGIKNGINLQANHARLVIAESLFQGLKRPLRIVQPNPSHRQKPARYVLIFLQELI